MQEIRIEQLVRKLQTLAPERLAEVEDFIDFHCKDPGPPACATAIRGDCRTVFER